MVKMGVWDLPTFSRASRGEYIPLHSLLGQQTGCTSLRARRSIITTLLVILACFVFGLLPSPLCQSQIGKLGHNSSNRDLITYVYRESPETRTNFKYFIRHGLHLSADFIFIFNGETDAMLLLPTATNIQVVQRENTCYDLGSHAEVLLKDDLWKKYTRFIMMNGSVRGPFLPHWAEACWSDKFLNKVTDEVKLVGTSLNCWPTPHVQSMVWGTDLTGMSLLLFPPANSPVHTAWYEAWKNGPGFEPELSHLPDYSPSRTVNASWLDHGLNYCFTDRDDAIEAEIGATGIILGAGYRIDVLLTKFHIDKDYVAHCKAHGGDWDPQGNGAYGGINIHPYESIFIKTNRGIDPLMINLMTQWNEEANFTSYDYC